MINVKQVKADMIDYCDAEQEVVEDMLYMIEMTIDTTVIRLCPTCYEELLREFIHLELKNVYGEPKQTN